MAIVGVTQAKVFLRNVGLGQHRLPRGLAHVCASYLSRSGFHPCIEACLEKSDWKNKRKPPEEKTGTIRHGMGLSLGLMQTGGQDCASQAIVILNSDGSANPKVVEAHYLGVHHGLEAMTGCEQILDPKTGKLLNDNWIDYPVSTFLDGLHRRL